MAGRILIIVQRDTSDPGRVGQEFVRLGYELDLRVGGRGDRLPETMDEHDGAMIFGGPMSANDDATLPFIRAELDWIPVALKSGKPFLGICLGGQLLARALGAKVEPHAEGMHEIGYFPVRPTPAGRHLLPEPVHFYQWHSEGFALPHGATLLGESDIFANQFFRYGEAAYGVQFHPEATSTIVERWSRLANYRLHLPGAQSRARQLERTPTYQPIVARWLESFIRRWLSGTAESDGLPEADQPGVMDEDAHAVLAE